MQLHSVSEALQLATSPVILISACGMLLLSMTNRLGRAIDRARIIVREDHPNKEVQLSILKRRAGWIRSAILYSTLCISFTAILVFILFLSALLPFSLKYLIAALFIVGLLCLIVSLAYFIADIFTSLKAMEAELDQGAGRKPA